MDIYIVSINLSGTLPTLLDRRGGKELQSWTKVLGTVLQCAYFFVISRFPLKTMHHFRNFLALLPALTLYKVETRKKSWIHAFNIVCGVRGGVNLRSGVIICFWLLWLEWEKK